LCEECWVHVQMWCGHEYTVKNLEFAAEVDKENKAVQEKLQWAKSQRAANQPTIPSTIGVSITSCPDPVTALPAADDPNNLGLADDLVFVA
jgi:hypothetical protein